MTILDHGVMLAVAVLAGAVNAMAGGGSLLTFPVLLAIGIDPISASITNTAGLLPGYFGSAYAYRSEVHLQRQRLRVLIGPAMAGAVVGAWLLLVSPEGLFDAVVPFLILGSAALLAAQPHLAARIAAHRGAEKAGVPGVLVVITFLGGIYGAYFGGALGVILLAALGITLADDLARVNVIKVVLSLVINATAVCVFVFVVHISWSIVAVMGIGSFWGGQIGVHLAQRIGSGYLRLAVVSFATVMGIVLLATN
jgi:hypothetical protein